MPKFLEEALAKEAAKKGLTGKAADHYIFGAMNNLGAVHGNVETAKGREMEAKHTRDMAAGRALSHAKSNVGHRPKHWSGK